jgi:hypothetical protein
MGSTQSEARHVSYLADGAILDGTAVKFGTDDEHVTPCSANTDEAIGLAHVTPGVTIAAEDCVEVFIPGGGGFAKCGETVTKGKLLVPGAAAKLFQTNVAGDRVIAMALADGVVDDVIPVEVLVAVAGGADN